MTDSEKDALIVEMREGLEQASARCKNFLTGIQPPHETPFIAHTFVMVDAIKRDCDQALNSHSLQKHIKIQKAKDEVVEKARELLMCGKTPDVWKEHTDALDKLQESLDRLTQLTKE